MLLDMKIALNFLAFLLFQFIGKLEGTIEYDSWANINLQHALMSSQEPVFTERGNITIQSLSTGSFSIQQKPLSQTDRVKLRDLAANNEYYLLKSIVMSSDEKETVFLSSVKACMLAESDLNDILSVSLDYSGKIITVTLAVASTAACEGAVVPIDKFREFSTNVYVRHPESGPIPDTITYLQKIEKQAKEKNEVKDNRSFFAKYWMYIVPVVIIMVLSSASNPEGTVATNNGAR